MLLPIPVATVTIPIVFLWCTYGFPMVFLWRSGKKNDFGSNFYGYGPYSYGFPMPSLWFSDSLPMVPVASRPKSSVASYSYGYGLYSDGSPIVHL